MSLKYSRTMSSDKFKNSPYIDTKTDNKRIPASPRTEKMSPLVQDSLHRITSPYKKKTNLDSKYLSSPTTSSQISWPTLSPTKIVRPATSVGKYETFNFLDIYPTQENGGFPSQDVVQGDLKSNLVSLKTVMREYEEKQKEKKTLQKVVEQLKSQIGGMQARKLGFSKNYEKLHLSKLEMNKAAQNKGNERVLIEKQMLQERRAIERLDQEIQESISMNVDVAQRIKQEQELIMRIREEMAEIKKILPLVSKEKDRARADLQVSSKLLQTSEEKFTSLTREKSSFLQHINKAKMIKN